jgi:hypothetical protein
VHGVVGDVRLPDEVLGRLEPLLLEELREVALNALGGQALSGHLVSSMR